MAPPRRGMRPVGSKDHPPTERNEELVAVPALFLVTVVLAVVLVVVLLVPVVLLVVVLVVVVVVLPLVVALVLVVELPAHGSILRDDSKPGRYRLHRHRPA